MSLLPFFQRRLRVLLVLAYVAVVAGWLAGLGWPFELFAHFRPQVTVGLALLAAALLVARSPRAAVAAVALLLVQALPGAVAPGEPVVASRCEGPPFVVVTANVEFSNADHARFVDWLRANRADVVVVQEVTESWARDLGALRDYPYRHVLAREDPYGIAILSRRPFASVAPVDLVADGLPSLQAIVPTGAQPIHVLGMHTHWPVIPSLARARDVSLARAAALVRESALPTVLVGDLNLGPDSPAYARLLADSRLRDAMAGRGWQPTWMAGFWPFALRLDYQLASPSLCVQAAEVGPSIGSDHRPVRVQYRLPAQRPAA